MIISGKKFMESNDGTLVAEISDLQLKHPPLSFSMIDVPKEWQNRSFTLVGVDKSGDDIAGWRFEEVVRKNEHPPKVVLIIND